MLCRLAIVAALAAPVCCLGQTAHFTLHGEPGEILTGGNDYDFTYTNQNSLFLSVQLYNNIGSAFPDRVLVNAELLDPLNNQFMSCFFSTRQLGIPIQVGTYLDAERAPFESPGHPGLSVEFASGFNTLKGSFTINSIAYHPSGQSTGFQWTLDHFDASFIEYGEGSPFAAWGTLTYDAVPEPQPLITLSLGGGLLILRRRRRQAEPDSRSR